MLTSRPRDKKCGDEEKKAVTRTFNGEPWNFSAHGLLLPSLSSKLIALPSTWLMKDVTIAKILIATCFGPIPQAAAAAAALVSAWLPISFHNSELSLPPNPQKPAQAAHGCTFIWLQLHLKAHKFWRSNLDLALFIPEILTDLNLGPRFNKFASLVIQLIEYSSVLFIGGPWWPPNALHF